MKDDIRTLDLNLLKALDALLDEGSVTRAAQRLSLTQPAVSGMLVRLRDYFGDPLFIRTSHGMVPTLRACELAGPTRQILTDIALLVNPPLFDPLTAELTYTIAATDYALKAVVVPLIAALKQTAPRIRIAVKAVENERLSVQLAPGELGLALVTPQTTPEELHGRARYKEEYICVAHCHHPLSTASAITLQQFCEQEHVLVSASGHFTGVTDEALAESGLVRRVGMSVNSFLVIPDILRSTSMIAVVPARTIPTQSDLVILPLPLNVPGFIKSMAWHERTHRDPAHQWIRTLCLETAGKPR